MKFLKIKKETIKIKTSGIPIVSILFLLLVFAASKESFAQIKSEDEMLWRGFSLYLINGYAVAYNIGGESESTFRVQFDFATNVSSSDEDLSSAHLSMFDTTSSSARYELDDGRFDISISPQYIHQIYKNKLLRMYAGGGPSIVFYKIHNKSVEISMNKFSFSNRYYERFNTNYRLGLNAIMGCEVFFSKSFSIFTEFSAFAGYTWSNSEGNGSLTSNLNESVSVDSGKETFFNYGISQIRIGAGYHF